jgi:hypothetical protein
VSPVREALVVAVDQYADEGLGRLRAPADDAAALGAVLGDPRIGNFAVRVLRNESAQTIRVAVEDFFADRKPDDLLLLHFSCHGLKNAAGELYLAASDSRPDRLASTAVPADFVNRQMADSRAQRIALFLDCCYGGAFPRGMVVRAAGEVAVGDAFATQRDAGGRGRVVVTASSSVEYAFEGAELASDAQVAPSVFTGSVVAGLESGEADRDGDGWVGLNELFGYVAERVRRATPHQTPHLWAFGSEGDLLLAHSGRRRVKAGELPAEVVEAIGSSFAATRLGVAVELRDRLLGPDLGQALAAWNALTGLASDDSRRVSATAEEAVHEADLRVTPDVIDLGVLPPGSRQVVDLRLSGPPLALVASAVAAEEWLSGEVDDDGLLHVAVAPPAPGTYQGTLVISSPTGEHPVPVRLEVVPGAPEPSAPAVVPSPRAAAVELAPEVPDVPASAPSPRASTPPARSRRAWLSVPAAQLVACIGLGYAYVTIDELWYMPNRANLGTYSLDGFGLSIITLAVAGVLGLTRPKLAVTATAVAGGIGLFFLAWGYFALGNDSMNSDPAFRDAWRVFLYGGLAVAVLTVVDLARRRMFEGPVGWQRPSWRRTVLLGIGTVLAIAAVALDIDDQAVWNFTDAQVVVVPFVAVTLTWVAVTARMTATGAAGAAAVAFLSASTLAALYLGVNASSAFAAATAVGDVCLLVAVILASRQRSAAGSVGPAAGRPPVP